MKPNSLLVAPGDDFERAFGRFVLLLERLDDLQRSQHPDNAVEPSAVVLAVDVRTEENRIGVRVGPLATGEDVPHLVNRDVESGRFEPLDEVISRVSVLVRERGAVHAATVGRPDAIEGVEPPSKSIPVYAETVHDTRNRS